MIPQTLFNMNMFVDGISLSGDTTELTLPKLTVKTEAHRAGGMDAEIDMDMGLEKLDASFSGTGIRKEVLKWFGLADQSAFNSSFRGSFKSQKGEATGVVATLRGMLREVDPGSWKAGDKNEFKYAVSVSYYKLEVNGVLVYEIDPINMVRVINGVDQLQQHRTNLGL